MLLSAVLSLAPRASAAAPLAVHVQGNHLIDASGQAIRLLGVNYSGAEYMCVQGRGIFDGPTDAAAISSMKSWNLNAVRLPLNEDCWLGINGVAPAYSGANYVNTVVSYVNELNADGLYVIVELQWSAPGACLATGQQRMPDADHSLAFWRSVATAFREDPAVVFDLYSEPHDVSWGCWKNGCRQKRADLNSCAAGAKGKFWKAAGMQQLVTAVRKAGATQPIMLGGLQWAYDLSRWSRYAPKDPLRKSAANPVAGSSQLIAAVHSYCGPPGTDTIPECQAYLSSLEQEQLPSIEQVARKVPVVAGEFGEYDCSTTWVNPFMEWADSTGVSYLGWTWNPWDCHLGPALITDFSGTPTDYGIGLKNHLAEVSP